MRAFLASSISVACTAALVLPALALPAFAAAPPPATAPDVPGSTQSLPLAPLPGLQRAPGESASQGLAPRNVHPFSLVGVIWDDVEAELHGTVQVRTRAAGTPDWSEWQDVVTDNREHGADPDSAERTDGRPVRGSTAPLWVGASDGVEVRVRPQPAGTGTPRAGTPPLPNGLRLELVDPGPATETEVKVPDGPQGQTGSVPPGEPPAETLPDEPPAETLPDEPPAETLPDEPPAETLPGEPPAEALPGEEEDPAGGGQSGVDAALVAGMTAEAAAASAVNADLAPLGSTVIPARTKAETDAQAVMYGVAKPYIGPRPTIVTRKGWGANEAIREKQFLYTNSVKAAFIHHSATGNRYTCRQAPSVLRSIYRYHVESSGWRDLGYNFAIDKCGNIYEGRAGGVAKAVMGAHTLGFNSNSMGIAVLGTYSSTVPPAAAVNAVARLTAWKLGLYGVNPQATTLLTSGGGNKFKKGTQARLNVISGHRDGFATDCPGGQLYGKLGPARIASAKYQGR
ncbi:N-acetylmuramoyl-L-alanine amidase [Streptomyces sp. NPDC057445]|uniref:peptidoglycan recognition protein family protein n=1 Tax=Streptomyces sp. NPDC057445 TaxID=3346136 RepID=UPI00368317B8